MIKSKKIIESALELGFSLCGVARAHPMEQERCSYEQWLGQKRHSQMSYMERNIDKRFDPSLLVEGARSVVVCAVSYKNQSWNQKTGGDTPKIATFAQSKDYHITIKQMLDQLLKRIQELYPQARGRCFVDTAPILEKSWAVEAGLGWRGKNSLLITPEHGSFVLLGEIVLLDEMDCYSTPFEGERCGDCRRCLDSCPAEAFPNPYVVDARRCVSNLTVESSLATVLEHYRSNGISSIEPPLYGWGYGCDECQSCCPYNRETPHYQHPAFEPLTGAGEMNEVEFEELLHRLPLGGRKRALR